MNSNTAVAVERSSAIYDHDVIENSVFRVLDAIGARDLISKNDAVVLKPNWVKEHDERWPGPNQWEHIVTHPCVIQAVAEYVCQSLDSTGSISICDAPQTDSSFATLRQYCGLDEMLKRLRRRFPQIAIDIVDLRPEEWTAIDGIVVDKAVLDGDPRGSTQVSLNEASEFVGFGGLGNLYGASYDMAETNARHRNMNHEYMLCTTPMACDLLINIPKLKTHKKVGITCSLKNLVGINANKNWLPHHTEGTPADGGDQYPSNALKSRIEQSAMARIKRILAGRHSLSRVFVPVKKIAKRVIGDNQQAIRSGNWHGNDTCWRMVLDLNKCLFYYDEKGEPRSKPRKYLSVVDGIIGGHGNGPMAPDPYRSGVLLAGKNPVAVDSVCAALMGFDFRKISTIKRAFECEAKPLINSAPGSVFVVSNEPNWNKALDAFKKGDAFAFRPHFGWLNAIEFKDEPELV